MSAKPKPGPGATNYIGSANRVADLGVNKGGVTQGINRHVNGPDRLKCMVCKVSKPQVEFSKSQIRKFVDCEYKPWAAGKSSDFKVRCLSCTVRSNEQLMCVRCNVHKDLVQFKKTQRKIPDEAHCIPCMQFLIESERKKQLDDSDGFGESDDEDDESDVDNGDIDAPVVRKKKSEPKPITSAVTKKMEKLSVAKAPNDSDSADEDADDSDDESSDDDIDAPVASRSRSAFSPPGRAQPPSPTLSPAQAWYPTQVASANQSSWNSAAKVAVPRVQSGTSSSINSSGPAPFSPAPSVGASMKSVTPGYTTPSAGTATPGSQSVRGPTPAATPAPAPTGWNTVASRGVRQNSVSEESFPPLGGGARNGSATPLAWGTPVSSVARGTPAPRGTGMVMRGGSTASSITSANSVVSGATTRATYSTAPTPRSGASSVHTTVNVSARGGWIKASRAKQEVAESDYSYSFVQAPSLPVEPNGIANGQVRMARKKKGACFKKDSNSDDSDDYVAGTGNDNGKSLIDDDNEEY